MRCVIGFCGSPSIARCSQVTWFRSWLFSTSTTSRGSSHWWKYFAAVISSAMPFICIAPSPTSATAGRCGWQNFAAIAYGTPGPIVARVPVGGGAGVRRDDRVRRQHLAQLPEQALRVDRVGVLHRPLLEQSPPL